MFLEPGIYDKFASCHVAAVEEWKRLKNYSERDRDGIFAQFWSSYSKVCQLVRDRIKSLAVVPRN